METSPLEEHALGSLVAGLIALDPDVVRRVTSERLLDGAPSVIAELLVPAGAELRRRRRDGEIDQAVLAGATGLLRRAVLVAGSDQHAHLRPGGTVAVDRPRVVVTCPDGVDHLLGAEALGEVLRGIGWPVDVVPGPGEQLGRHLTDRAAMALVVSCTDETGLAAVARAVDAAHAVGIPVVVTGAALGSDGLRALRLGADVWIAAVEGVAVVLDSWRDHHVPVAGPRGLPSEFASFEMAEVAIVATALAGADVAGQAGVRRSIERVVAYLGAAVLVDDTRILLDHLGLHLGQAEAGGLADLSLVGLVDAVAGAVPPELERSRRFISEAREHLRRSLSRSSRALPLTDDAGGARSPALPRPATDEPVIPGIGGGAASPGQAFADLLLLGALACQAPVALLSVPQVDGQWSTLSYGCEHRHGLNDPLLFDALSRRDQAVELPDLTAAPDMARSPLVAAPHNLRWAYGVALRAPDGVILGVFCVLDRWPRQLSRREQRATLAVGRQMAVQLAGLRKPATRAAWGSPNATESAPTSSVPTVPSLVGVRRAAGLPEGQQLLRSHEVAVLFDVTERTVINWAGAGKLPSLRTIGGHLRFRSEDVHNLLAGRTVSSTPT